MTKLTDTQGILLSSASQRADGSILPLPPTLAGSGGTTKAVNALITRGYAEERETSGTGAVHRTDGDIRWGVYMTTAGAEAIGISDDADGDDTGGPVPAGTAVKRPSKTAIVLALLERPDGATLPELIEPTEWLPHTTRAALTGIRKKGHDVQRSKRGDMTCYRIIR